MIDPRLLAECISEDPRSFNKFLTLLEYDERDVNIFGWDVPKENVYPWIWYAPKRFGLGIINPSNLYLLVTIPYNTVMADGYPKSNIRGDLTDPVDLVRSNSDVLRASYNLAKLLETVIYSQRTDDLYRKEVDDTASTTVY